MNITQCRYCQSENISISPAPGTDMHGDRARCGDCGKFLGFITKKTPDRIDTRSNANLRKLFSFDRCQICLRSLAELRNQDTLEVHHIVRKKDGGTDEMSNLMLLCTGCHKTVHVLRRYTVITEK